MNNDVQQRLAQAVTAQWSNLGVDVLLETAVSSSDLREKLAARDFDVALVDITPFDPHRFERGDLLKGEHAYDDIWH